MKPALAVSLAAAVLAAAPARAADTYLAAKLGYLWPSSEVVAAGGNFGQVPSRFYWEAAVGVNESMLGLELSGGHFSSDLSAINLSISTVPVLLALQLRIPIPVITPYVEVGGGAFFNSAETPNFSESHVTWGYLLGGGVDLRFVPWLLLGAEARYLSADSGIPNLTYRLDSVTLTAKIGFYL
ncbi:MAG TPA: outer membrane beta-barrel protein [Anaeromyxobacteraceae bacterium]|nr:outer membrane beta-barrel protein [Anaeromyxobacteraceae bacterium]